MDFHQSYTCHSGVFRGVSLATRHFAYGEYTLNVANQSHQSIATVAIVSRRLQIAIYSQPRFKQCHGFCYTAGLTRFIVRHPGQIWTEARSNKMMKTPWICLQDIATLKFEPSYFTSSSVTNTTHGLHLICSMSRHAIYCMSCRSSQSLFWVGPGVNYTIQIAFKYPTKDRQTAALSRMHGCHIEYYN